MGEFCSEKYSSMAEGNMKVGRYSVEERRERIDRYRAKRTLRNFSKTIKVNNIIPSYMINYKIKCNCS